MIQGANVIQMSQVPSAVPWTVITGVRGESPRERLESER